MQSATSSRRHNRRHLANRSQIGGSEQDSVADGARQMASMATAVTPSPVQKQGRHFTDMKFADAPISLASKEGIHHE